MSTVTLCCSCRWWDATSRREGIGVCRRHAPRPVTDSKGRAYMAEATWPSTVDSEYCGDAEPTDGGQR